MQETQILSTQPAPVDSVPASPSFAPPRVLVFDACHMGVVLRAVLFVEAVVSVGALYGALSPLDWLQKMSLATGAALPGTLAWLILACSLKQLLQRLRRHWQYVVGVILGALSGLYGCSLLALTKVTESPPWVASSATGALLAALLVTSLVLRARGRTPAATTARLTELQARIRPHFLFNTLNSAIALVRAEPAKAEELLEDLSDLFRHALMEQGESATLAEEIALAQRYLAIEQVRFGPRLQIQWLLDPSANDARLPPLLLQPLVENAVKHGVEPSAKGGKLRISTQRRADRVVVRITNTLPSPSNAAAPRAGTRGHGMALDNVRARLALMHDVQSEFRARAQNGTYEVRIALPC
jgi:two-component system sensor histidine kinase AlgZ